MRFQKLKTCWCLGMLTALLLLHSEMVIATTSEDKTAKEAEEEKLPGLAELVQMASELDDRLNDLDRNFEEIYDFAEAEKSNTTITQNLEKLAERLQSLKSSKKYAYEHVAELKSAIRHEEGAITDEIETISAVINKVENWRKEWLDDNQKWTKWQSSSLGDLSIPTVVSTFAKAQETIAKALQIISQQLEPLLLAELKAEDIRSEVLNLMTEVDGLMLVVQGDASQRITPPMFSSRYYAQFGRGLGYELRRSLRLFSWPSRKFFAQEAWVIISQILLALVIAIGIKRNRPQLEKTERGHFLAKRPFATGLTFSVPIIVPFYGPVPPFWSLVLWIAIGFAVSRLVGGFTADLWKRSFIYGLTAILIVNQILVVFGLPLPFLRLYVFFITLIGTVLFIWRSLKNAHEGEQSAYTWILRIGALFLIVVLIAEIAGQSIFAVQMFDASLKTIFFVVLGWVLVILIRSGIELAVQSPVFQRVSFLKENADVILRRLMFLIKIFIGTYVLAFILVAWRIYNLSSEAIQAFLSFGFKVGSQEITVGLILAALAILYGSYLASWIIQALFMEEVLRRRQVENGIRISMARLVHYAMVLVGFLVALSVIGFDLKNITILGGALGVGIGFGLQTVVNNFVCGLIMLFERPIKVGDTIQLGNEMGRIKKVGLRATTVQTYDNSEIVVPNSDLITSQVTNWTLAERLSRIKILVGVAYGSDVALVMQTMIECAEENPLVLKNPEPKVLFMGFGASSLDFELRVWVEEFDDRLTVSSELHREIDKRFRLADIEIPFPQRDLHLRSVDTSAAPSLNNSTVERS
ncbi:MAG: mechanosensitive ion channel [Desulfobacterales bacterium]|nr:MAG: mechanosensitive ion channel [Desulfobacterales bacterium]